MALAALAAAAGCSLARPDAIALSRLDREIGQLLLVGFSGTELSGNVALERLLCEDRVGGVVLFTRNIVDAAQVHDLTSAMSRRVDECTGRTLLIAADAEGGPIMRLSPRAGFSETLSHRELGVENDFTETELEARRIGRMLRESGINWNLAPVVDVGYNPANPVVVVPGRSFSANPALVTAHARAYIRGIQEAGVLTALKHFPGHGSSLGDSHLGFVDVTATANPEIELAPYRALIAERVVDSVMTAHVFNRHLDRRHPATLSRNTIAGLLRQELGFRGAVVTDDLRMAAIIEHYGLDDAVVLAMKAGGDVLLLADDRLPNGGSASRLALGALRRALARGRIPVERFDEAIGHVAELRSRLARLSP